MRSVPPVPRARHRFPSRRVAVTRPLLLLLPCTLALAGCVARRTPSQVLQAGYSTPLVEVARPAGDGEVRAPGTAVLGDSLRYSYADSIVEIRTAMLADRVALAITNRTDEEMTVVWEDARYADYDGALATVTRAEGRRGRRSAAEAPTVIPPRRTFVGAVLPDSRVVHYPGREGPFGWKSGGWGHAPLMTVWSTTVSGARDSPDAVRQRESFVASVRDMMGKRIGVMIPLRSRGMASTYTLWFAVQGAAVIE